MTLIPPTQYAGGPSAREMTEPLPEPRRRLVHVFTKLDRGGAELRTLEALRALGGRSPVETHILIHSGAAGALDDEFRRAGAVLHHIRLTAAGVAPRFIHFLRDERIDAVHSHVQYFSGWLLLLAKAAGIRTRIAHLWITENPPARSPFSAFHRLVGRELLRRHATRVLSVGRDTMSIAYGEAWRRDARCRVVYGGVPVARHTAADLTRIRREARAALGVSDDETLVCHVGRYDEAKNHERVVRIFAAMGDRCRLLLVGGGSDKVARRIRRKVREHGVERSVIVAGVRDDVLRLVAASDVLLFPSTREGLPGAVLEALSVGTPCVASAIPGTREIAEFSPAIELVGLDEDDRTWAARVRAAAEDRSLMSRVQRMRAFAETPFTGDKAAAALAEEWARA